MTIERGTTQTVTITVKGWDLTGCDIYATFKQGAKSVTKKTMESVTYESNATKLQLTLTQKETMSFDDMKKGKVQVRWIDSDGIARKTKIGEFDVDELLYEVVLTKDADD